MSGEYPSFRDLAGLAGLPDQVRALTDTVRDQDRRVRELEQEVAELRATNTLMRWALPVVISIGAVAIAVTK